MSSRHGTTINSPSLIPLFGGTDRKSRPLDREVVTLGRARGSDFCLDANEVSALHCVIYRASDGFRVRDCGSRTGTRVNGNAVKNAVLNNGDVLNIGPFSFEMRIPADYEANSSGVSPVVVDKLRRSRQKLARRALKMRQRLQIALSLSHKGKTSDSHNGLLGKVKKQEDRMREMEDAELELIEERENLVKEQESLRKRVVQVERDIEERLRQADAKIKAEWESFQQRVTEQEAQLEQQRQAQPPFHAEAPLDESQMLQLGDAKAAFELERATFDQEKQLFDAEISDAKAHLDRQKQTIAKAEEAVRTQRDQIAKMIGDLKKMQEEVRKTQKGDTSAFEAEIKQLKQSLAGAEAKLAEPRVDPKVAKENERLTRMVDELEQRLRNASVNEDLQARLEETIQENDRLRIIAIELEQQVVTAQQQAQTPAGDPDLEKKVSQLENENELLHHIISELKSAPPHAASAPAEDGELREENDLLRKLLAEKDRLVEEVMQGRGESHHHHDAGSADLDQIARENDTLREMLRQREEEIAQLQLEGGPKDENDLANYEAELNQFRQQLEKDRSKLNTEFETMRVRNEEMDETIREMEMQMSRERAEMARERQRLDRMREEIKLEMERMQRDNGVRESLATVHKLREEINGRPPSVSARPGTQPTIPPARNLNDRLSNLRPGR